MEAANYYPTDSKKGISLKKEAFEKALSLFISTGEKKKQADVLKNLGDFSQILNQPVDAMTYLNRSLSIYQSIGFKEVQGVYDLMGIVSTVMGDYPNAVKYGLLAVKIAEGLKDTTIELSTFYNRLALSYMNWAKKGEALLYFNKAMTIARKYKDLDVMEVVLTDLSVVLNHQGRWEESLHYIHEVEDLMRIPVRPLNEWDTAYKEMWFTAAYTVARQYHKAGASAERLINVLTRYPEVGQWLSQSYLSLVSYYMAVHRYPEAKKYVDSLLYYAIQENDRRSVAMDYLEKASVDSALGDFNGALADYQASKRLTDSMLNETASFQFAQMQVEYETEKKDSAIRQLRQQDEIQQSRITQVRTVKNIVVTGLIISAVILGLLYSRYRIKQRSHQQLEAQQKEINQKNLRLESLVKDKDQLINEKEWLVREIHHRVKNNLQIVISLLNAQSDFLDNPTALAAIAESRERMHAIAIIHQKLYQTDNNTVIGMRSYIHELTENIRKSADNTGRICFQLNIHDICLDISQSVPLGLILNEAITNAIKHAFYPQEQGTIIITLKEAGDQQVQLSIMDNGKGLPEGMNTGDGSSLGLHLIHLFAEQLDARLQFLNQDGLEIRLLFNMAAY